MFKLHGLNYTSRNFIYANHDSRRTQAMEFKWKDLEIEKIKEENFLFLRKITEGVPQHFLVE